MKNIRTSNIVKAICYCLVPILVLLILVNGFSCIYYMENEEDFTEYQDYTDTNRFADDYFSNIKRAIHIAENEKYIIENNKKIQQENHTEGNKIEDLNKNAGQDYETNHDEYIQYNFITIPRYDVLLISPNGTSITNVEKSINADTTEKIKEYILSKQYFWKYDGKTVETDIHKLSYDEIKYSGLEYIQDAGYQVYIALKDINNSEFYTYNLIDTFVIENGEIMPSMILICSVLLIICCFYIFLSIGHKQGQEEIYTNTLDKIPYEVIGIIATILLAIEISGLHVFLSYIGEMSSKRVVDAGIILSITIGFVIYATLAIVGVTTVRRIKAHIFWKNTLLYQLYKFAFEGLFTNLSQTVKLAVQYGGFILASFILAAIVINDNPIVMLVLLVFWYYVFKKILNYIAQMNQVREKIKNMYHGEIDKPLKEEELYGELKQVARELNDISGGLSNAIEEATKSERLKTELITNVSHDIKTPLTSIINYVDLMKQEKIENPKLQEYLEVLDNKSQRLKKLTEDLIEASKASSGNIKLTMEKLNVKELIKQVSGEFEDRFAKKGLQLIETFPEEDAIIEADSRYLYRVMENMYVNISKYALENSRVYIDVTKTKGKVQIALKNISQDELNITANELMQRFVRGDSSRTTEGSGLGISIAKSLTELQKGSFDIYLDGDLFKVVIEFKETKTIDS